MTEIRNSLNTLATAIESLQNAPIPEPTILDRQLSGNKINGGSITSFASTGITDRATSKILVIRDDGLHVDVLHATTVNNPLTVKGDLTVEGTVHPGVLARLQLRHERAQHTAGGASGD